jgi:hypothetical protein
MASMTNGAAVAAVRPSDALPHLNDNLLKYRPNIFTRRSLAAMARGVEIG